MSNKHGIFGSIQKKIPQSRVMDNNDPEGTRRAERVIWEPTKTHPKEKKKKGMITVSNKKEKSYKYKKYLLSLISGSLMISVRDAFIDDCVVGGQIAEN